MSQPRTMYAPMRLDGDMEFIEMGGCAIVRNADGVWRMVWMKGEGGHSVLPVDDAMAARIVEKNREGLK